MIHFLYETTSLADEFYARLLPFAELGHPFVKEDATTTDFSYFPPILKGEIHAGRLS